MERRLSRLLLAGDLRPGQRVRLAADGDELDLRVEGTPDR